jgi:hypothetical protein
MCAPLIVLALAALAQSAPRTELTIRTVDQAGNPVRISQAELYLDYWGGGDTVALPVDGTTVRVPLGREWVCAEHAVLCENNYLAARIVIRAVGYAAVASERFTWIGSIDSAKDLQSIGKSDARVVFAGHESLTFRPGTVRTLTLVLRRAEPRKVRLVDDDGHPVADAEVTVSELMARSNHTGHPEGKVVVDEGRTNGAGEIAVPDSDMVYAIRVGKPHYRVVDDYDPIAGIATRLKGPVTTFQLRRAD